MTDNQNFANINKKNRCAYRGCTSSYPNKRLFRFPQSEDRRQQWIDACENANLRTLRPATISSYGICGDHFSDDSFAAADKSTIKRTSVPVTNCTRMNSSIVDITDINVHQGIPIQSPRIIDAQLEDTSIPKKRMRYEHHSNSRTRHWSGPSHAISEERNVGQSITENQKILELVADNEELTYSNRTLRKQLKKSESHFTEYRMRQRRIKSNGNFSGKRGTCLRKNTLKKQREAVMKIVNEMEIPPTAKAMISLQLHRKNTVYSDDERNLAKQFHYYSPAALRRLRKAGCNFPSSSSLRRWIRDYDIKPGFTDTIFRALKEKLMKLNPEDRRCCLKFDETTIKSWEEYSSSLDCVEGLVDLGPLGRKPMRARSILVFCLDSISAKSPWRQPIAYFLPEKVITTNDLKIILLNCLDKLKEVDADVKLITCDQGSANQSLFIQLKVVEDHPYFDYKDVRYFAAFDFPHLIKRLTSLFRDKKKGKIYHGNNVIAAWDDFVQTWTLDKANIGGSQLLSHISEKHMNPAFWEAMNVKRAFQIFSRRFSRAISTAGVTGALCSHTWEASSNFADELDGVIDACNSYSLKITHGRKRVLSDQNPDIARTLREFVVKCKQWSTHPERIEKVPCMRGLVVTVQALLQLYTSVKNETPDFVLATGLCNQDSVEHLFSKLRQRGGFNANPTARMNRISLRHIISSGYIHTSDRGNVDCPEIDNLLNTPTVTSKYIIKKFNCNEIPTEVNDELDEFHDTEVMDDVIDYQLVESQSNSENNNCAHNCVESLSYYDQNAVTYLSGFVAFRTLQKNNCQDCKNRMCKAPSDEMTPDEIYLFSRDYGCCEDDKDHGEEDEYIGDYPKPAVTKLTRASSELIKVVGIQLRRFHEKCDEYWASENVSKLLINECILTTKELMPDWFDEKHQCHEHRVYALRYLILVKLHALTRTHNRNARKQSDNRDRKGISQKMKNLKNL